MNEFDIEEAVQNIAKNDFQPETFIYEFLKAYNAPPSLIKQLQNGKQNFTDIAGAILWRRNLHFKKADTGEVLKTIEDLEKSERNGQYRVRFIIATDGREFIARDLIDGNTITCLFNELGTQFQNFLPLAGIYVDQAIEENPVDEKATKRLTKFYDTILEDNPNWRLDENRKKLNHFITQIIFCLFAEDTGIIEENLFSETIRTYCTEDSSQAVKVIKDLFTAMANEETSSNRIGLSRYTKKFPYVNGGLFRGDPTVPRMTRGSVRYLLDASALDWKDINPDIFGSMIQAIVNQDERSEMGMHYTSVKNILKVLNPLFLNTLKNQVQASWNSKTALKKVLERLTKIRIFDPACGSGNFLVIAYRELRHLEIKVIRRLFEIDNFSPSIWSHVNLTNFFGIEIADFAAETASLSLWIAEFQMNKKYGDAFGKLAPSLPLKNSLNIINGNALRLDWFDICPQACDPQVEIYIVGNPPYHGSSEQSDAKKSDMDLVFQDYSGNFRSLDYVCGWFFLASQYIEKTSHKTAYAFVSTNSIVQGIHPPSIASFLNNESLEIFFGETSFTWKNNASSNAAVIVVIIGVRRKEKAISTKKLFSNGTHRETPYINSYLLPIREVKFQKRSSPINNLPVMDYGSKPADGGHLILNTDEANEIIESYPEANDLIVPFLGSQDYIRGLERCCIWISDSQIELAKKIPPINSRIELVRDFRLKSRKKQTREFASVAHSFAERRRLGQTNILIVPRVSSIRRKYLPIGFVQDKTIIADSSFAMYDVPKWCFSLLASQIHLLWISTVCGKLKNDFRYSNTLGWNTFPSPILTDDNIMKLNKSAEKILLARDYYFEHTIADLYDPDLLREKFPKLLDAHLENDFILENIYNGAAFKNNTERLEHLFERYVEMSKADS